MKTIIIFATKHGSVENAARLLKTKLGEKTDLVNLAKETRPSIEEYDTVILGGSIYAGNIQKSLTKYIGESLPQLLQKNVGLFICAAEPDSQTRLKELTGSFPPELYHHAKAKDILGYEIHYSKMNFFEKMIVRSLMKIKSDHSALSIENIDDFAKSLKAG
ncbi:flavodoxin [Bacillus canaveralius]|uniref:Flavodoxin n=1 Tax=Bacillus canaveralius TaxID=1403243 RepID=A0A2N5GSN7_9BACI|nr:flavodoxin domain-containing protein [Bacillus canaveralius]PLR86773.1 flavodoxin [Bacillus canaveralius]PLR92766.1 flavodoxin [Bacillus canaveralius]RSK54628.1 flavodoxin [Bacillus canaveralius]